MCVLVRDDVTVARDVALLARHAELQRTAERGPGVVRVVRNVDFDRHCSALPVERVEAEQYARGRIGIRQMVVGLVDDGIVERSLAFIAPVAGAPVSDVPLQGEVQQWLEYEQRAVVVREHEIIHPQLGGARRPFDSRAPRGSQTLR
jgi:hypothetical protein